MNLKYKFETLEIGDDITAVPVGENSGDFHGVLQLNDIGAKMLSYIAEYDTPEEVLDNLCKDYPNEDINDIALKLCSFMNGLTSAGILLP